MAILERVYTIPFRKVFSKRHVRRGKYAMKEVRAFAEKHMKGTSVKIGTALSQFIMRDGIQKPPRRVKVTATRDDLGVVRVNLFGTKEALPGKAAKEQAPAGVEKGRSPSTEKPKTEAEKKAEKEAIKAEVKK